MSQRDPRENVKPSPCTACGKVMDSAWEAGPGNARPKPGDASICFYCHHLMVFGDDLALRDLTDAEIVDVAGDPSIVHAMELLGGFKAWEAKRERRKAKQQAQNRGA
jgi:hypothetical protein